MAHNLPEQPDRASVFFSKIHTFDSFKNPAFRHYFLGMVGQWSGMNMQMVTNSLLAYRVTGSAAILGIVALANAIPVLVLSLLGGVAVDRFQKKTLLQIGQAGAMLVSLVIGFCLVTGYLSVENPESWLILLGTSIFQGIIAAFVMTARQSIIPELVSRKDLMNAVSLNTMGMNIFRLASPALAGLIIDFISFEAVYFIMAGLFASGVIFNAFLPRTRIPPARGTNPIQDIKEGFQYMRGKYVIIFLLSFAFSFIVLFIPFQNLLPVFSESVLRVGATGLGVLMSISGAGALLASFVFATIPSRKRGLVHLLSTLLVSVALLFFCFSSNWTFSLILMIFIGIGQTGHVTTGTTLLQTHTEPQYLGRVMSIMMMNWGLSGLGTFLAGFMAHGIGIQWAIGGFAAILTAFSLAALLFMPKIRNLE
ncbi:MAG TPA: MFS transporter [Dehalococcoidales bacterium]|nr:MFS transporter [Dehalococcoidales bacterium]